MSQPVPYHAITAHVAGGTEVAAGNTGAAGASVAASLPATPGVTNFITHLTVTAQAVAAVVGGTITITGVVGGPLVIEFVETVTAGGYSDHIFTPPIPATAQNTAITATLSAIAGGSASAIIIEGWQA